MFSFLGKNLIGYRYSASGNQFFYGVNPKSERELPIAFVSATSEEVEEVCVLAERAFSRYAQLDLKKRTAFIERIVELLDENREQLVAYFSEESGLPIDRAHGELNRSIFQFRQYIHALINQEVFPVRMEESDLTRLPSPKPRLEKKYVPIGPVVVFGASNFPFAYSTLGGDVASALAAGCPVIVKGHSMHPHTSSFSAELIRQAAVDTGMPEGVFSHVLDGGYEVGQQLVQHPLVQAIGFTGSIAGGTTLMKLAQSRRVPIPVFAEMGSVNPIFILEDALHISGTIAKKIADSVALNAGQFCTSPGFVFVPKSKKGMEFTAELIACFKEKEPQCMLHPDILSRFAQRVVLHANFVEELVPVHFSGNFITPGLSELNSTIFLEDLKSHEELFGSYLNLVYYSDMNELLTCVNRFEGQLTMSVFSQAEVSEELSFAMFRKAGRVILNGVPTGVEVSPAQQHGGPYPSSSSTYFTAVGSDAVLRFMRPVAIQSW